MPAPPSELSLCPMAPPSSLLMTDCPRPRCQRKPQRTCGGGSCCLRHKVLQPSGVTLGPNLTVSPNRRQKGASTAGKRTLGTGRSGLGWLKPCPNRSLEGTRGERAFPATADSGAGPPAEWARTLAAEGTAATASQLVPRRLWALCWFPGFLSLCTLPLNALVHQGTGPSHPWLHSPLTGGTF